MRRSLILLASTAIIFLGLWGSAVIFLDEQRLKSVVASQLSAQSGRKVEIRGALSLGFFPRLRVHAEDVVMAAPEGFDGPRFLFADEIEMSVRLLPLIRGRVSPTDVRLSGATLNLYTDFEGRSSVDGLVATGDGGVRRGAELLMIRQLRLEDVRVVIADMGLDRSHTVQVEQIEFDRFAFDEPLEFRFQGNLGEPALFSYMEVEGLLHVPSSRRRPVRLSSMRMHGELSDGGWPVELLGHLWMSSYPEFSLELADGRLGVGGQRLDVSGLYSGQERPHLRVDIGAQRLDIAGTGLVGAALGGPLLALFQGADVDATVELDQAQWSETEWEQVVLGATSRDGMVRVDSLQALLPGAILSGQGGWDLADDPYEGALELALSIDDASLVMSAFGVPAVLSGTGEAHWTTLQLPLRTGAGQLADGRFQLWDGSWAIGEERTAVFDEMNARFLLSANVFDVPELGLILSDSELMGWLSVNLVDETIGGRLLRVDDGREIDLFGELSRVELSDELQPGK